MKKLITLVFMSMTTVVLCLLFSINIRSQESSYIANEYNNIIIAPETEQPIPYGTDGYGPEIVGDMPPPLVDTKTNPVIEVLPSITPETVVCGLNQETLDNVLTDLNELFGNMMTFSQIIIGTPGFKPTDGLTNLLINNNMPQDVSRTCKVLIERINYLQRLSIELNNNITYALKPPSAEQSALT